MGIKPVNQNNSYYRYNAISRVSGSVSNTPRAGVERLRHPDRTKFLEVQPTIPPHIPTKMEIYLKEVSEKFRLGLTGAAAFVRNLFKPFDSNKPAESNDSVSLKASPTSTGQQTGGRGRNKHPFLNPPAEK